VNEKEIGVYLTQQDSYTPSPLIRRPYLFRSEGQCRGRRLRKTVGELVVLGGSCHPASKKKVIIDSSSSSETRQGPDKKRGVREKGERRGGFTSSKYDREGTLEGIRFGRSQVQVEGQHGLREGEPRCEHPGSVGLTSLNSFTEASSGGRGKENEPRPE